jgi:pyrroloquinoline quinone biosynthesis protein D
MMQPAFSHLLDAAPVVAPMYRLQYEAAQESWVLLYPEGMVRLNGPASEILRRCDGHSSVRQIVSALELEFGQSPLCDDVCDFLRDAYGRGWIV